MVRLSDSCTPDEVSAVFAHLREFDLTYPYQPKRTAARRWIILFQGNVIMLCRISAYSRTSGQKCGIRSSNGEQDKESITCVRMG